MSTYIYIYNREIQVENHQFHQDHTIPQAFAAMTTEPFACQLHRQSPASEMTASNDFIVTNKQQKLVSHISNVVSFFLRLCILSYGSPIPLLRKARATTMANEAALKVLNRPMQGLHSLLPTIPTQTLHKAYGAKHNLSVVQVSSSWKTRWSCGRGYGTPPTSREDEEVIIPRNLLGTFGHKVLLSWNKSLNSRPAAV